MVLTCTNCEARLQIDDAKTPARPFTVRCPKCEANVSVQPPTEAPAELRSGPEAVAPDVKTHDSGSAFERPASARPFKLRDESGPDGSPSAATARLSDPTKLLSHALGRSRVSVGASDKRLAWDRRKVLVCASPAYRETIAESLARNDYEVFVAENMAQGLGRMREERMDVVVLDANFDPLEQGVAFITREVRLLRPAERRRIFFVSLTAGVRPMDLHAAFLQNVNLVVNPSDVEQLPEALDISMRHYNDLYRPFNRALDMPPI